MNDVGVMSCLTPVAVQVYNLLYVPPVIQRSLSLSIQDNIPRIGAVDALSERTRQPPIGRIVLSIQRIKFASRQRPLDCRSVPFR